jgi:hypothetical protein
LLSLKSSLVAVIEPKKFVRSRYRGNTERVLTQRKRGSLKVNMNKCNKNAEKVTDGILSLRSRSNRSDVIT